MRRCDLARAAAHRRVATCRMPIADQSGATLPASHASPGARAPGLFCLGRMRTHMNADLERLIALQRLDSAAHDAERRLADEPEREKALERAARGGARARRRRQGSGSPTTRTRAARREGRRRPPGPPVEVPRAGDGGQDQPGVPRRPEGDRASPRTRSRRSRTRCSSGCSKPTTRPPRSSAPKAELAAEQKAVDADRQRDGGGTRRAEGVARAHRARARRARRARSTSRCSRSSSSSSRRRNGIAVAEARDGICTICHVRLRPQVFNTVLRNDQIIQCDSCQRILYFVPPAAPAAADALAAARDAMRRSRTSNRRVVAYIDGGARGNPGPAGYGVRIEQPDGTLVEEFGESIGVATNNVAEYRGLLAALEWARAHGHTRAARALRLAAARAADARQLQGEAPRPAAAVTRRRACSRTRSAASPSSTSAARSTPTPIGWPTRRWTITVETETNGAARSYCSTRRRACERDAPRLR